jgi:hypothetical protein
MRLAHRGPWLRVALACSLIALARGPALAPPAAPAPRSHAPAVLPNAMRWQGRCADLVGALGGCRGRSGPLLPGLWQQCSTECAARDGGWRAGMTPARRLRLLLSGSSNHSGGGGGGSSNTTTSSSSSSSTSSSGALAGALGGVLTTSGGDNGSNVTGIALGTLQEGVESVPGVGVAGLMLRLMPASMTVFVTFFGTKVSTVMRAGTVYVSSAGPLLVPVLQTISREKTITVTTFLGLGGALYAGALGCFASVKNRSFGIMVQGVALGYIIASMVPPP